MCQKRHNTKKSLFCKASPAKRTCTKKDRLEQFHFEIDRCTRARTPRSVSFYSIITYCYFDRPMRCMVNQCILSKVNCFHVQPGLECAATTPLPANGRHGTLDNRFLLFPLLEQLEPHGLYLHGGFQLVHHFFNTIRPATQQVAKRHLIV